MRLPGGTGVGVRGVGVAVGRGPPGVGVGVAVGPGPPEHVPPSSHSDAAATGFQPHPLHPCATRAV
jgi:hypothetical protein